MKENLLIILGEINNSEITFDKIKENLIDKLDADLCLCIENINNNSFVNSANYIFELDSNEEAFLDKYWEFQNKYELIKNSNTMWGQVSYPGLTTDNCVYIGRLNEFGYNNFNLNLFDFDELLYHNVELNSIEWRGYLYGIKKSFNISVKENGVDCYKKSKKLRDFIELDKNIFDKKGLKDLYIRHNLYNKLRENNLLDKYERFIIASSDRVFNIAHPSLKIFNKRYIWKDNDYIILSNENICEYLNILENIRNKSIEFYDRLIQTKNADINSLASINFSFNNKLFKISKLPYLSYRINKENEIINIDEYNKNKAIIESGEKIDEYCLAYITKKKSINQKYCIGTGGLNNEKTYNVVLSALKIGYRVIDTGDNYHNEEAVGRAIVDSGIDRNEIVIISKYFGGDNFGVKNSVIDAVNCSLQRLNTDYIDIYLIHKPGGLRWGYNGWEFIDGNKFNKYKSRVKAWIEMIKIKELGLVNKIGVSNWTKDNLEELRVNNLSMPEYLQIEWCPNYYDIELYDYCIENSIKIMGYGLFSRLNVDSGITSKMLIDWVRKRDIITIIRSDKNERLLENFSMLNDEIRISDEEMRFIDNSVRIEKGHCLFEVYKHNISPVLFKPLFLDVNINVGDNESPIMRLIRGDNSCLIFKNFLNLKECKDVIRVLEEKRLISNDYPQPYKDFFRPYEIGITLDNIKHRDNPEVYWEKVKELNNLFDETFENKFNPFEKVHNLIKNVIGDKYKFQRMKNESGIESPMGIFRALGPRAGDFPYHTDGFNYGKILNERCNLNRDSYPCMSLKHNTNAIVAIVLILQNHEKSNEVSLYNCLVDDLEDKIDEIGMWSHWMGTKYNNIGNMENVLSEKPYYSPLLETGDLYFFSASRIHRVENLTPNSKHRITMGNFIAFNSEEGIFTSFQ